MDPRVPPPHPFISAPTALLPHTTRRPRPSKGFASSKPIGFIVNITRFGNYLGDYLALPFYNHARGERSTRLFINQGLWAQLLSKLMPGDFVIIEMGYNDNGSVGTSKDVGKDRAVLPGLRNETVVVTNTTGGIGLETVHNTILGE
jgi:hypothetical protein